MENWDLNPSPEAPPSNKKGLGGGSGCQRNGEEE